ncbi:MAG: hypothetical protein C0444_01435 [Microbacterium sp.]|nr:hypothetical protein [Microbacterium sp.]MBA4344935.1 hypothetical protein [Microbacterium sp.]
MRVRSALALSTILGLTLAGLTAVPATAATFTAATETELVTAITDANSTAGADTITLTGTGFALTSDLPGITERVTIAGPGSGTFTLDANGFQTFNATGSVTNTTFSLSGITIVDAGSLAVSTFDLAATLTDLVVDSEVEHVQGSLTVTGLTVSDSGAIGLDVTIGSSNVATLTNVLVESTFELGIYLVATGSSTATLTNVTVTDSGADDWAGIEIESRNTSRVTVVSSTFSNNGNDGLLANAYEDSVLVIDRVTANGNDTDGIDVDAEYDNPGDNSSDITVTASSVNANGDSGFESTIRGGVAAFSSLTSTNNDDRGFDMAAEEDGSVTITTAVARGNDNDGIELSTSSPDAELTAQRLTSETNGQYGLDASTLLGTVEVDGATIRSNDRSGVRANSDGGAVTVRNATIASNNAVDVALGSGGGVDVLTGDEGDGPGSVLVENSTINGNRALEGGGVRADVSSGATFTLRNSTVSGNEAEQGGSLWALGDGDSEVVIEHSTLTLNDTTNSGGVAVESLPVPVVVTHSIIEGNTAPSAPADIRVDSLTIDYSLIGSADAVSNLAIAAGAGNIVGEPSLLGPLANNGGPTLTHVPLNGSPAFGAGNAAISGAPSTDQRGQARVVGVIEIGAVEMQAPELAATGANSSASLIAGSIALALLAAGSLLLIVRRRAGSSIVR